MYGRRQQVDRVGQLGFGELSSQDVRGCLHNYPKHKVMLQQLFKIYKLQKKLNCDRIWAWAELWQAKQQRSNNFLKFKPPILDISRYLFGQETGQ